MDEKNLNHLKKDTILNGRYVIRDVLGAGGFGITYFAEDTMFHRKNAIKEFFPRGLVVRNNEVSDYITTTYMTQDDAFKKGKERFLREARLLARFNENRGIVHVQDFFEANNTAYIVMEYLDGITLKEFIQTNGPISERDILELMAPLFETLDEVHKEGLIHRDISPDNIMMMPGNVVKLMDFGAARDYTEFGEKSLSIVLKPGFAPPEQYQTHGVQGPWTDIYALCATMYRCVTGQTPEDSIERVMDDQLIRPSAFGVSLSPQFENALLKGMSINPKDRYQNLWEFCNDLYGGYGESQDIVPIDGPDMSGTGYNESFSDRSIPGGSSHGSRQAGPGQGTGSGREDKPEQERSPVRKAGGGNSKIIAAVAALVLMIAVGGWFIYQRSLRRVVPDLSNMSYSEAVETADGGDGSLIVKVSSSEYSDTVNKGSVISQSVEAGTVLKKGDEISVVLSKGALITLEDYTGMSYKKAEEALINSKLSAVKNEKWSDDVKKGIVISQSKTPGTQIEEGESIVLTVSKGVEQVTVPDVSGLTLSEAKAKLKSAKLKTKSETEFSSKVEDGKVISQSIKAGKSVTKNKTVK
ncbi:MAG: PASTA domain-containing protein, partial [Eubacterium sp.]|nr:PASTA domain-containing protein [Eubacterium sp.]